MGAVGEDDQHDDHGGGERRKPLAGASAGRPRISVGHSLPPERGASPAEGRRTGRRGHRPRHRRPRHAHRRPPAARSADGRRVLRQPGVGPRGAAPARGPGPARASSPAREAARWSARSTRPTSPARRACTSTSVARRTTSALRTQLLLEPVCAQLAARHPLRHADDGALRLRRSRADGPPRLPQPRRRLPRRDLPARRQPDHRPADPGDHPHRHRAAGVDDGPDRAALRRPATSTPRWPGRSPAVSRRSPAG